MHSGTNALVHEDWADSLLLNYSGVYFLKLVIEMALRSKAIHSPLMGINHSLISGTTTWPVVKGSIVSKSDGTFSLPRKCIKNYFLHKQ